MKNLAILILSWVCVVTGVGAQEGGDPPVKLVRSISNPLFYEAPAQFFYIRPSGEGSSYLLNAALQSRSFGIDALGSPGLLTTEFQAGVEISKNTVDNDSNDRRLLAATLASVWHPTSDKKTALLMDLTAARYIDRLNESKGNDYRLNAILIVPWLKSTYYENAKPSVVNAKLFPVAGIYRRHITSTDDVVAAPRGHVGGPYIGLKADVGLGEVSESAWFNKWRLEAAYMRIHDASASAGYRKAYYNFFEASLRYAFYSTDNRWKPSIAITRTVGTDRLGSKQYKAETSVGLMLSYGLK